ncbi:hypothetical protein ACE01N_20230 [Saccharicrinis sp. FJH2]|uniref:hypothetical protein n=1 Tax=unclassified Saccharicrinis TaxID=2646859 RepID=UPI0035D3EABB
MILSIIFISIIIITIIEGVTTYLLVETFFNIGIPVFKRTIEIDTSTLKIEKYRTIVKDMGRFQFTRDNKVYFLTRMKFFSFRTSFPFKIIGTIKSDDKIDIVARLPLGTTLIFLLIISSGIYLSMPIDLESSWIDIIGVLSLLILLLLISFLIEYSRLSTMIEELKEIITTHNTRS